MASIAEITLIGNLGKDPETKYTPNGRMSVQFTMAVSRRRTDNSGNAQETTNWFRVTCWGRIGETMDRLSQQGYFTKGKQVYVSGQFEAREYQDQQGQNRTSLDVNASQVLLTGSNSTSESAPASDEGVPF